MRQFISINFEKGEPCKLADCPPGLFVFEQSFGFKHEYGETDEDLGVFCADSGEYFWGGTSTREELRQLMVVPLRLIPPEPETWRRQ
jgi:hypothetical protein